MGRRKRKDKKEEIKDLRTKNYRQTPDLMVKNEDDAVSFINFVGICLLFPTPNLELPNLLQSVYGMPHPMTNDTYWDKETLWTWNCKDDIPQKEKAFYGKFMQDKGTFLSPSFITYFYAVLNLSNESDNYKSLFHSGEISSMAKNIADIILEKGTLSTKNLKKNLNIKSRKESILFQQAISSLQNNLIITNFGREQNEDDGMQSTKYELVSRVFYDEVEKSQHISSDEARKLILKKYINVVVQTNEREVSRIFGWNLKIVENIFKELIDEDFLDTRIEDKELNYFCKGYDSIAS